MHVGPLEYDRQVVREFTWGAWFWDPYRSMGMPRLQDLGMRPLYPVPLGLVAWLPTMQAWHWNHVVHTLLKAGGLVLLGEALGWPFWIVVLAAAGAMVAEGSLVQFTDTTLLLSAAWLPLHLWLTLKASRRRGFTAWDGAWALVAALRVLSFHPQFGVYYEVLLVLFMVRVEWGDLRRRWPALLLRYVAGGLMAAPALIPGFVHYLESGRRHITEFDDWHLRRAYLWRSYRPGWREIMATAVAPWGAWLAVFAAAAIAGVRATTLWPVFAGYFVFALFHAVPWLALPMWLTGKALFPFRLPQRAFEPFSWLGILLLAEVAARASSPTRRRVVGGLLVVAFAACLWQTRHDPRSAYILPPWDRPLPERLAATVRAEPPSHSLFLTGPDRLRDDLAPILNSNHADFLRVPAAHFAGQVPSYAFNRMAYRVPGLLLLPRGATHLVEWDAVVDLYAELGIEWVWWDGTGEPRHPRLAPAGEESGIRLYRIEGARPLVYALDRVRQVPRPSAPSGVTTLVYSLPALGPFCYDCAYVPSGTAGRDGRPEREAARLRTEWRAGDVRVEVEAPRDTIVVLNETRSTGWSATVDGVAARIHQINEAFQGVVVPAGRHVVRWTFVSPGFFAGLAAAAAGLALVVAAPVLSARRLRTWGASKGPPIPPALARAPGDPGRGSTMRFVHKL